MLAMDKLELVQVSIAIQCIQSRALSQILDSAVAHGS
jgi:hypothetical protein